LITGDFLHHPCQMAWPQWCMTTDDDQAVANCTRRRILAQLVDEGDMRHWHALRRSDRGSRRSRRRRVASRYQGVTLREKHRCGHHFSRLPGACALHACLCSMSRYFESLRSTRSQPVIKYPARENIHRMAYFLYLRAHRPANTRREAG
jgi:hypothetical protein